MLWDYVVLNARVDMMQLMIKADASAGGEGSTAKVASSAILAGLKEKTRFLLDVSSVHGPAFHMDTPWDVPFPVSTGSFVAQLSSSKMQQMSRAAGQESKRVAFSQRAASFDQQEDSQSSETQPIAKSTSSQSSQAKRKPRGELLRAKSVGYEASISPDEDTESERPAILCNPSKSMVIVQKTSKQLLAQVSGWLCMNSRFAHSAEILSFISSAVSVDSAQTAMIETSICSMYHAAALAFLSHGIQSANASNEIHELLW